ncbi:hypothetical protein, partial [Clostridium perfringens]
QRDRFNRDREAYGAGGYNRGARDWGQSDNRYGSQSRYGADQDRYGASRQEYHGSYGHDGRRFLDVGQNRHADDDTYRGRYDNRGS